MKRGQPIHDNLLDRLLVSCCNDMTCLADKTMEEAAGRIVKFWQEAFVWRAAAEELARQLGKVEYAEVEYWNQKELL